MRLFIAINLTEDLRATLDGVIAPVREQLPSIRWVAPERFHITLKFIGDCTAERAEEISAALQAVAAALPHVECTFGGAGVFPNFRRPRVVWVGVQQPLIVKIAAELERALEKLGVPADARAFSPHLTVGRIDRDLGDPEIALLAAWTRKVGHIAGLPVRSLELMQSDLGKGGPTYTLVTRALLGPHHC